MRYSKLVLALAACIACTCLAAAAEEKTFTKEQMKQFLLNAKVVASKHTSKGITSPWRLTLSDGTVTHDASFQSVDERKAKMEFEDGHIEMNFADSYKFNIAAYALAEMLGIDDIMPVYIERKWNGNLGSLSWWLAVKMDEGERKKQKLSAPNVDAWNKHMYRIRVFDALVYDTDANLTNVLIDEDWKPWRVDFSRAFRVFKELKNPKDLVQCDRLLFEKLRTLDGNEFAQKTRNYLTKDEQQAVMARRDKIVAYFRKLIAEKGENSVLY